MKPLLRFSGAVAAAAAVLAKPALAHCPLCAAATAGGVAATRFLGVDDAVTGTFMGGFVVSTALWFDLWLKKKRNGKELLPFQSTIFIIASLALTILTFYLAKLLGSSDPAYHMFGVDKLLVGTIVGTAVTVGAFALHKWIRKVRGGKSLMPFQGIIVTLLFLAATGVIFYFITRRVV
ncbi:hypothetical protein HYV83_01495 [Candidatus Woesearchaeota archaeon]|nr:hypothetical protein [Candidatus Woesearchaeota archaeon]